MRDRWDRRALVAFAFFAGASVIVVNQITGLHAQVAELKQQQMLTNEHLAQIQHQECLDANTALRATSDLTHSTIPVYRPCP